MRSTLLVMCNLLSNSLQLIEAAVLYSIIQFSGNTIPYPYQEVYFKKSYFFLVFGLSVRNSGNTELS